MSSCELGNGTKVQQHVILLLPPYVFLKVQNMSNGVGLYYADSDKQKPMSNGSVECQTS